jgi:RNA polymerase sigma-70 factor (ECF subfamily)
MTANLFTRRIRYAVRGDETGAMGSPRDSDRDERFKSYYQRYFRRVVRFYVSGFRLSEEDAEELAQEAFIRFYEAMDDYRGDAEWAFFETIARNLAYNRIRFWKTQKRNALVVDIDDPDARLQPAAPGGPDYAERAEASRQRERLHDAIAELPRGQRECMQLWLDDFKYDEIAKALRISMDAVKSRLRDAKKILRERLGGKAPLPEDEP